jgi:ABC-type multidrug transport system fused ATPase/permease subunit
MNFRKDTIDLLRMCLQRRKRLLAETLAAVLFFNMFELLLPKLLQLYVDAIDGNELKAGPVSLDLLATPAGRIVILPAALIVFALLRWAFTYARTVLETRLGQESLFDLRSRIFNTMQNLSFAYHDSTHSGTLISNVVEDVNYAQRFFRFGLTRLMESSVYIVLACAYMIAVCPPAGLASASLIVLALFTCYFYFKYGHRVFARTKQLFAEAVQIFSENMEGQLVVRAFGSQSRQREIYNRKIHDYHNSYFKELSLSVAMNQSLVWAVYLGIPAVIGAAVYAGRAGWWDMTTGELFKLFFIQSSLQARVRMLGRGINLSMWFGITAERLGKLFKASDYLEDKGSRSLPKKGPGSVEARDVSFAYKDGSHALKEASIQIEAGSTVGLVGRTGTGKTSLALLLCRFYDPVSGQVLLDGRDIRSFPIQEVRNQFSLVFQETFLFSASIKDNIAYGKPGASFEEIVHAATVAQAHDFIMELPEGYDTVVGERGVTLSGGQRQRTSIARAILRRPRFLILDACTSAVDPLTEKAIQDGLAELRETSTVIIIAQRYSSIADADRVYVLRDGYVAEQGSPDQLNRPGTAFSQVLRTAEDQRT